MAQTQHDQASSSMPPAAVASVMAAAVAADIARESAELHHTTSHRHTPEWMEAMIVHNAAPNYHQVLRYMPIIDPCLGSRAPERGVIRILKAHGSVTKSQVLAALDNYAQVMAQPFGSRYRAIHITMSYDSGRTKDVFVEVTCSEEAAWIVETFQDHATAGRMFTLEGFRDSYMVVSTLDELMAQIFRDAKRVTWYDAYPAVEAVGDEVFTSLQSTGFEGFITEENAVSLVKLVTDPGCSYFTACHPQRPYESVISILHKYPVYQPDLVFLKDRKRVFDIAYAAVKGLAAILREEYLSPTTHLTEQLLRELAIAALRFKLFTDAQKALIIASLRNYDFFDMVAVGTGRYGLGGEHILADRWPFLALIRGTCASERYVQWYVTAIRTWLENPAIVALNTGHRSRLWQNETFVPFFLHYAVPEEQLPNMTFAHAAQRELKYIEDILARYMQQLSPP